LSAGLVLRTAATESDVERVAAFNGVIHGSGIVNMTRRLFLNHPDTTGRDLIFVEDPATGQVVSSLCLIPWTLHYDGAALPSGEMGIVGTLEGYRHRGLIREQVAFFKQRLAERGCLLSHIQGIPYYYRQFGYEYALPLEGGLRLTPREIPPPPARPFTFRRAVVADLPVLMRFYDEAAQDMTISVRRSEGIWRYLLEQTADSEMECEDWVIADEAGLTVGYFRVPLSHFGDELPVNEVSRLSYDAALAVLSHLKTMAEEKGKPGVRLNVPASSSLMRVARPFTTTEYGTYAWQIHVPDMAALLHDLAPVLERRVACSLFAGMTRNVDICLYRETLRLRFEEGRLIEVVNLGYMERGGLTCPPLQFIPLVLGYRTLDEQRRAYPDVGAPPAMRPLVDVLFPRVESFLYTIY
jgi:hypothetical protein